MFCAVPIFRRKKEIGLGGQVKLATTGLLVILVCHIPSTDHQTAPVQFLTHLVDQKPLEVRKTTEIFCWKIGIYYYIVMLFIHTHTVYCRFSSGPSQGDNQSICESTATTNNQSRRTSNLPESPLVQSHLSAATVLEDGYDSDAHQNHNAAIEMEGPQELDEPELGEVLDPSSPSDNQAEESKTSNNQPEFVLIPNNML